MDVSEAMSVCCECCVVSGRGLCDGLITHPEESCVCVLVSERERERERLGAIIIRYDYNE